MSSTTLGAPHSGLYHLHLTESGAISRTLDLTSFQRPTLRFWRKVGQVPLYARVYDGAAWTTLLALEGAGLLVALRVLARRVEPPPEEDAAAAPLPGLSNERAIAIWGLVCLVVLLPVGLGALRALL